MKELIKRALEVRNALRYCAGVEGIYTCRLCAYSEYGCRYTLMLDSAKVIERLIEEVDGGEEK